MKCNNCGTDFFEGVFCPECGTKYVATAEERQKAHNILDELDVAEKEKTMIKQLGWSEAKEVDVRIQERLLTYGKAKELNMKTVVAQQLLDKMKSDIKNDYREIVKKGSEKNGITLIVWIILAIFVGPNFGIIGIIIGICGVAGSIMGIKEGKVFKELAEEIKHTMDLL